MNGIKDISVSRRSVPRVGGPRGGFYSFLPLPVCLAGYDNNNNKGVNNKLNGKRGEGGGGVTPRRSRLLTGRAFLIDRGNKQQFVK